VGDLISTESFYVSSVLNALPVTGGTISGNLVVTGTASITGVTTLTGGLNTPLAVTSGGTGVTTSTGTGANVLGTSPTLVTPLLGTPTSGVLDNCSGQNLTKAWVNYDGVAQSVRASFNVSSVTYNAVGTYTVNFTNAFSDAKYTVVGSVGYTGGTVIFRAMPDGVAPTTTYCQVVTIQTNFTLLNSAYVMILFNR
jgi:hypothetical protein